MEGRVSFFDSRYYRWLEMATNLFLLNLLWLAACVPVLTIFPATAAMFGVVRGWIRGSDTGIVRPFFERLRENFWQSLIVGTVWTLLGLGLILDLRLLGGAPPGAKAVLYPLLFLAAPVYALASVFLFPVMVHYETTWRGVLKNSLLLAIGSLPTSALGLLVVTGVAGVTFLLPALLLITGSATAYLIYRMCDRTFRRIEGIARVGEAASRKKPRLTLTLRVPGAVPPQKSGPPGLPPGVRGPRRSRRL